MPTTAHSRADQAPLVTAPAATNGSALTGQPECPKCGGRMWDNRATKRNPKAPDFKCRDRRCNGVLWPGQHNVAAPIITRPVRALENGDGGQSGGTTIEPEAEPRVVPVGFRACYLDVTDFVLRDVCPRYADAGTPCTDATLAAIVATLFIAMCREAGR